MEVGEELFGSRPTAVFGEVERGVRMGRITDHGPEVGRGRVGKFRIEQLHGRLVHAGHGRRQCRLSHRPDERHQPLGQADHPTGDRASRNRDA